MACYQLFHKGNLALSQGQFGKQKHDTYFVWSRRSQTKSWYWFLHVLGTLQIFFQDISLDNETWPQCPQRLRWRLLCPSVHPKTQHLKSLFGADIVYLQQLQLLIRYGGGGPQLLIQGFVCAYRLASQMGGTFSPWWREQRENLKQLILRDCLWFFLDFKKM